MSSPPLEHARPGPVRYAVNAGARLAYRSAGAVEGAAIVLVPGFASHVDALWDATGPGAFHARLADHMRLVAYDRRGQGRSSRVAPASVDDDAADLEAVLDAADIDRAVIVGLSQGGAAALALAASAPDRVAGLVLVGAYARASCSDGYPHGLPHAQLLAVAHVVAERWGDPALAAVFAPSAAGDAGFARWWTRSCRMALTPDQARAHLERRAALDVRDRVASIQAPTLVIHRTGDRVSPVEHGRWLAANIAGAEIAELPGEDHLWWLPDPTEIADLILRFAQEHAS